MCACLLAAGCSGGGTGPESFSVRIQLPSTVTGDWVGSPQILNCRPAMVVTATGQGRAVWTGGTYQFTVPNNSYSGTFTADEVAFIMGAPDISGGQSINTILPRSAYTSFHVQVSFAYTVEGTGQTGTASDGYDCEAQ